MKANTKNMPALRFPEFKGEWETKRMKDFTKINQGLQIAITERYTEQIDNSYFYITNEFLKENSEKKYYIKNPPTSVLCDEQDLLMTRTGNTGKVVTGVSGAFHNNFFKIKFDKEIATQRFLYYFLTHNKTQHTILKLAGTSTIPDLNHSDFYKIYIALPQIPEQQKIADFLSSVDERIQQLTKKKQLLEQYKKGVMQQLFSQQLRFKDECGNNYPNWEEKKLGEIIKKFIVPMRDKPTDLNGEIPWCRIEDFEGKYLSKSKSNQGVSLDTVKKMNLKIYPVGTLLVSCSANLGYCAIVEKELITNQTFIGLVPLKDKVDVNFLYYTMKLASPQLNKLSSGTTISYLSRAQFEKFSITIPSFSEQQKIANFLSSIDSKIEQAQKQIDKTQAFKKGLLQQMFV